MLDKQYWGLDPLFTNHLKLFTRTIKSLEQHKEYEELFLLGGHVIQFAQIYGVIVAVESNYAMNTYIVDDNTDCLPCCVWNDTGTNRKPLQLGTSVRVRGRISEYNGMRQINAESIDVVVDLHEESLHYLQAANLLENVYLKPFNIPEIISRKKERIEELFKREIDDESNILETNSQHKNMQDGDEDNLLEAEILSFLSSHYTSTTFPASVARDQEDIVRHMMQVLRKRERKRPDDRRLTDYYTKRFEALLKEGHIVQLQGRDRLYKLLPVEQLKKHIIHIINQTKEALYSNYGGVTFDYIALRVRQHEIFQTVPNERIHNCLRKMVDESLLYLTSPKEYALVPDTYA